METIKSCGEREARHRVHGTLVEVLGVGVLLRGPSGIGKSEVALGLVRLGHKLIADDAVFVKAEGAERLFGEGPELLRHQLEIRGVGIVDIRALYGESAVGIRARVELVCELEPWCDETPYERVGLDRKTLVLAGVEVPVLCLPVARTGNLVTIVELAARDHRQRRAGICASQRLEARMCEGDKR